MSIAYNTQTKFMRNTAFGRLTIPQQAQALLDHGTYLHTREEPGFFVDLYELRGLYIEIYFHKKQADFVVVKSFYSNEATEPQSISDADILYPLPMSWRGVAC